MSQREGVEVAITRQGCEESGVREKKEDQSDHRLTRVQEEAERRGGGHAETVK
jgi:hypothetical protein